MILTTIVATVNRVYDTTYHFGYPLVMTFTLCELEAMDEAMAQSKEFYSFTQSKAWWIFPLKMEHGDIS